MGRRRLGPVQLNGGSTYYARLTVPPALRQRAGKTRLIRSLGTTSHSIALSRYGATYSELEKELQDLLSPKTLKQQVEASEEGPILDLDRAHPETPLELTRGVVGDFNPNNPLHVHIFNYYDTGTPLRVSWDEAIDIWIEVRNRENTRPLSKGSISKVKFNVADFEPYAQPTEITFDILDKFVNDQEKLVEPSTVKSKLKGLSGVISALVSKRKIDRNILKDYSYKVGKASNKRAYTDDEFKLIASKHPACYWLAMTGMRSGELESGILKENIMIVTELSDDDKVGTSAEFRPKTLSSYRRVPLPTDFTRPPYTAKTWRSQLRSLISDTNVTPHSGRHFFIEVSRRAGCDAQVIAEICGHGATVGSTSQRGYGAFTDEVLLREAQKVWSYINTHIL